VNLDFTDEQRALRDTLREFFEKESPAAVVRDRRAAYAELAHRWYGPKG
jgi:alkylation response protein AidB-like acyl-CoA dehydrogenase